MTLLTAGEVGQSAAPYLEAVAIYGQRAPRRLHVPGHGGGAGADPALIAVLGHRALSIDVPKDIRGIDLDVRVPALREAEDLAAAAYGAGRTWFLTNGASQGNHAALLAYGRNERVLVQRNCHGSVIDGLILSGGTPTYLLPGYDVQTGIATVITPLLLADALEHHPEVRAALIVSPTYFGMVADIRGCAEVTRAAGVDLIVDGAWGPHFGFHPDLPENALAAGADLLVTSTHKHGGSLTQSAMLHVARDRTDLARALERTVGLTRSTSPSSLLLASLDGARRNLALRGHRLLTETIASADQFRDRLERIDDCRVLDRAWNGVQPHAWDPLRVVIDVTASGIPATAVAEYLRSVHDIHPEFCTHSVLVMVIALGMPTAVADDVGDAVTEALALLPPARVPAIPQSVAAVKYAMSPREAFFGPIEIVAYTQAPGRISAEAISAYPPGIPTVLPGELISEEALSMLRGLRQAGVRIHGASDPTLSTLVVTTAG